MMWSDVMSLEKNICRGLNIQPRTAKQIVKWSKNVSVGMHSSLTLKLPQEPHKIWKDEGKQSWP